MTSLIPQNTRRRSSVLVVNAHRILGFNAVDPTSKRRYFFIPGGKIEQNESPIEAAIRETLEETGYQITIPKQEPIFVKYPFLWDGQTNHCETYFYKGYLEPHNQSPPQVKDADYHIGVDWIDMNDYKETFSYCSEIKDAITDLLSR